MKKAASVLILISFLITLPQSSAQASLSASLGATKLDGLEKFTNCQDEAIGYREGIIADRLETKLGNTPNLPMDERRVWLNDIAILRQVQQTRQPDRTNNQHYLQGLTGPEQQAINSMFIRNMQEINLKCEQQHGGVLRFNGAGTDMTNQYRYEDELRSKMGQVIDINTIPIEPLPLKPVEKTPEEMAAQRQADKDAMRQATGKKAQECMALTAGLRPKVIAQMLQKKLDASPNLSAKERAEFQADIMAAYAAAGQGLQQVLSTDPMNPYKIEQRLSAEEQAEVNTQYTQQMTQTMMSCAGSR
ncbi:MAG: hypothetical protein KBC91_08025 [Candidatus Omnitrophica bacterium]|nr:hypothetical protein [Candidatus Omnitrophota bacterium]